MSLAKQAASLAVVCGVIVSACRPAAVDWGLDAIDGMVTPADDPTLGCGIVVPPDPNEGERARCAYRTGMTADRTLGVSLDLAKRIPIRHVIIAMKENRSFDHLFGALHATIPDVEAIPDGFTNPDANGNPIAPHHATTTCIPIDPNHQHQGMLASIDGGKMDGFVRNAAATTDSDGSYAMTTYAAEDLPFYYFLGRTYAIADRYFAPIASGTSANRDFMLFGTPAGVVDSGVSYPPPETPSIFHLLMNAGLTWRAFTDGAPFSAALGWEKDTPGVRPLNDVYDALDHGTLPNVSFVDGIENVDDDHPPGDLQFGEAWLERLYTHAIASPQWDRLVIFYTYDEGGAFFDHVPPPDGCPPYPTRETINGRGPRVPLVAISPWAKKSGYVSHVVRDHTALTRFIETTFGLPALTARDANSDALLDMFDFSCGTDHTPPPAPRAGVGGCLR